jgi:hypothetical protein
MTTQRTLTDIPDDEVDQVVSDFESEGCAATKKKHATATSCIFSKRSIKHISPLEQTIDIATVDIRCCR